MLSAVVDSMITRTNRMRVLRRRDVVLERGNDGLRTIAEELVTGAWEVPKGPH